MTLILVLIKFSNSFIVPISVLVQFLVLPKILICPTAFLKDGTEIHPRERKMQQHGHKCHVATISAEKTTETRSFFFLINNCCTNYIVLSNDNYDVTLLIHSHADLSKCNSNFSSISGFRQIR